jgi:hypothetical protein
MPAYIEPGPRRPPAGRGGRSVPAPPGQYQRHVDVREQYPAVTRRDARLDRERESWHIIQMQQLRREADEVAAEKVAEVYVAGQFIKARRVFNTEAKYELLRARKESQILAGEDPELAAKYALMDDDLYHTVRAVGMDLDS